MQKTKAKHKDLAFAPQMQDWISQERWSERIIAILCFMIAGTNTLFMLGSAVPGQFLLGVLMGVLGIVLWRRTSTPQKIQMRLRGCLQQHPAYFYMLGILLWAGAVTCQIVIPLFIPNITGAGYFLLRSVVALLLAMGIQQFWRGWKLGQMQTFYAG